MPRFFFHVRDGVDRPDREGTELSGIVAARAEALVLAGRIIMDAGVRADLGEDWRIAVTDEVGLTLFLMDFVVAKSAATGRNPRRSGDAGERIYPRGRVMRPAPSMVG